LNLITEFERKVKNKRAFAEAKTLDDQEWHLAEEMPTSILFVDLYSCRTVHGKQIIFWEYGLIQLK
jgi:hypothetical protein